MFFSKEDKSGEKTAAQQMRHNPYLQARQEWLERYGDYIAQEIGRASCRERV